MEMDRKSVLIVCSFIESLLAGFERIMRKEKVIYLTIDDGPSKYFKEKVDFLYSNKIPAIFFCRGDYIEKYPGFVYDAISKGFLIGNHSYNHISFSRLSLSEAVGQIEKTDKLIDGLYRQANIKRPIKIFRFPGGDRGQASKFLSHLDFFTKNCDFDFLRNIGKKLLSTVERPNGEIQNYLRELGYRQPIFENLYILTNSHYFDVSCDVLWTYDIEDWRHEDVIKILRNIEEVLLGKYNERTKFSDIILVHDHEKTSKNFYSILNYMKNRGVFFRLPGW